jgi:hypothetical protein
MGLENLLSGITVDEEVSSHDMETSTGGAFINACGVYPTTVERAFMTPSKSGGVQLDLHFTGENIFNTRLYIAIVDKKTKKKKVTCVMQGKTVSLPDFKLLKQLYFLGTGQGLDIGEIETTTEDLEFKEYGKVVKVEGVETISNLIGKEVQIGVRLEEKYNYEDGETDKTSLKTNQNGDVVYDKKLESVFSKDGFDTMEIIKESLAPSAIESKKKFLESEKGIKRVKLEAPEVVEDEVVEDDEIDF